MLAKPCVAHRRLSPPRGLGDRSEQVCLGSILASPSPDLRRDTDPLVKKKTCLPPSQRVCASALEKAGAEAECGPELVKQAAEGILAGSLGAAGPGTPRFGDSASALSNKVTTSHVRLCPFEM